MKQLIRTTSKITIANRWDHILALCGYQNGGHRLDPGLYALGGLARKNKA